MIQKIHVCLIKSCQTSVNPQDEAVTFTATWTPITYRVVFNANEGTGAAPAEIVATYDDKSKKYPDAGALTRDKFVFNCWNTLAQGMTAPTAQSVVSGDKVTKPTTTPTATNDYEFAGWYADGEFNTEFNFDTTTITADTTIYAKWNEVIYYTVTLNVETGMTLLMGILREVLI